MEYSVKDGCLSLSLEGRLDTDASSGFESEINNILTGNRHNSLIFDASELGYISSSGLRVILKMAKAEKDLTIVNVSPEVYNVFNMTGFSKIIKIEKAMRHIDLSECEQIGKGGRGAVYRCSEDEIVKVNYNPDDVDYLTQELLKAKEAFLLGVPTAISFDMVDCGEGRKGVIYEAIKSKSAGEIIHANPELMEEIVENYVAQIHALHKIHPDNPVFENFKTIFRRQIEMAGKYLTAEEVDMLDELVNVLPDGDCLLHGDPHPKNIMIQGDEYMWIDMELMSVGHPIFDLISIASVMKISSGDEIAIRLTGMDMEDIKSFGRCFIRKYFKTEDEAKIAEYEEFMEILRMLRRVSAIGLEFHNSEILRPRTIKELRATFFPNIESIKKGLSEFLSICL